MKPLKNERNLLEDAAEKLLTSARSAGAEKAEVCASFGQKTRITLEKQDYHMASSDSGFQFGVRVMVEGRQGFSSVNSTEGRDLKEVAQTAVQIARLSPANPHADILPSDNIPAEAPGDLFDAALCQVSLQTQRDWIRLMAEEAMRDKRFRLNEGSLEIGASLFLVANSLGTHKLEQESVAGWSLMGMGADGDRLTSFDYFSDLCRRAQGIPDRLVASTRRFVSQTLAGLEQGPSEAYKGVVVFSPRAALEILISGLAYHLNGRNLLEGTTRWPLKQMGEALVSPLVQLEDNPWLSDRAGCTLFDREGTPTRPLTLIRDGKWVGLMLDHYAAKGLGRTSTGHAVGGPSAAPGLGSHSLAWKPGSTALADGMADLGKRQGGLLVVQRYSGQADPITGDFSGVAKGGEWWQGGKRQHVVQETLISGNLFECLGPALLWTSRETEVVDASESAPFLAIDGVSVTAGQKA